MFIKHIEEMNRSLQNGWRVMPTAGFLFDLENIPVADKFMCVHPTLST